MWLDTQAGSERESHPVVLWMSFMVHFFWASFDQSFDLPGSESVLGISQYPPLCVHASLRQDGFQQRGLWHHLLWSGALSVFDFQGFCVCAVEKGFLSLIMRNMWSFIWSGPSLLCHTALMESLSTGSNCSAWGPSISCFSLSEKYQLKPHETRLCTS